MIHCKRVSLLIACALLAACAGSRRATAPHAQEKAPPSAAHHGAPAHPVTLEWLAETAILFDDLGTHHRAVTTTSRDAQAYFDQGLRLLYAFNHDEAVRSFAKAAALDPACAMCFWGASIGLGPNYNTPMLAERSRLAWEALQKAVAAAPKAKPVEQALIGALTKRYAGPEYRNPAAQRPYTEAYAAAMRDVAARFPGDPDVQVLFAESLMDIDPWKLWAPDGKPAEHTTEIVTTLEKALSQDEKHPGANHFYIHAMEASPTPQRALPSADRLEGLMPGAGHVVHMPAHIYQRVGRYADASEQNRRAVKADQAYTAKIQPWGYYPFYMAHNYGFLAYSASMEGRSAESISAARKASEVHRHSMPGMDFFAAEAILAMVRFGKWDEILAEPRPDPKDLVLTAFWLHGRGMALAAKGKLEDARALHAELVKLASSVRPELEAGHNSARDVMNVAAKILEARIAERASKPEALPLWKEAVSLADRLAYAEPADWFYPVRHYQGAALLAAKKLAEAEAVYRADLAKNPLNGWALFGLGQALRGQHKTKSAEAVDAQFKKAWARADITLTTTAF